MKKKDRQFDKKSVIALCCQSLCHGLLTCLVTFICGSLNIDINVLLNLGAEIGPTANTVQSAGIDAIEATTGLKVNSVNVHVSGLSLK